MYAFNRDPDHPVCVFDKNGNFLWSWGQGLIAFAHAIIIDKDQNVWLVDRNTHEVHKYTKEGAHLMTIGSKGDRSDTGVDPEDYSSTAFQTVTHGGPPFNMPAGIAFNDEGQIFIADGYANARVHKFTPQGDLIKSWGGPGDGAGEFRLPHGIWIDRHERVLVADRENDRVQVFTQEGEYISTWPTKLIGPALFYVDSDDTVYVPEHNGGLFSVLSLEGELITQWGSELHRSCHGVWADSNKDLYFVMPGEWGRDRRVVKFHRR